MKFSELVVKSPKQESYYVTYTNDALEALEEYKDPIFDREMADMIQENKGVDVYVK